MAVFLTKRILYSVGTLLLIAMATFLLMHAVPGGPYSRDRALPPAIEANIIRKYHLDDPVWKQLARYLGSLVRGDLGPSFAHEDRTTNDIIREGFPKSAALGVTAFLIAFAAGMPMGIAAAMRRGQMTDRMLMVVAVLGVSVPSFILASLILYACSYRLGFAPAGGWGESPWQLFLPAIALAGFPIAFVSRLVRSSMLAVLNADFVRTARAKGLSGARVILRHALRNALLPTITYAGPLLAALVTGSFVVEDIFAIPGLGRFYVTSINDRDYTVIMGITLFYSALLIGFNLVVDAAYSLVDPRISLD
jgi:oligopeptide transport system permease protein